MQVRQPFVDVVVLSTSVRFVVVPEKPLRFCKSVLHPYELAAVSRERPRLATSRVFSSLCKTSPSPLDEVLPCLHLLVEPVFAWHRPVHDGVEEVELATFHEWSERMAGLAGVKPYSDMPSGLFVRHKDVRPSFQWLAFFWNSHAVHFHERLKHWDGFDISCIS